MTDSETKILRRAEIFQSGILAGYLEEAQDGGWGFAYVDGYAEIPISLTLPVRKEPYVFEAFPAVLDGLLPEGEQLEALLKKSVIFFSPTPRCGSVTKLKCPALMAC